MARPSDSGEQVVYTMTVTFPPVGGGSSHVLTYDRVAGAQVVPGEIPVIVIRDIEGCQRAMLAATPGMIIDCQVTEKIKDVKLLTPDALGGDLSKLVH